MIDKLYKTLDTALTLLFPDLGDDIEQIILREVDLLLLTDYLQEYRQHIYDCKTVCDEDEDFHYTGKKLFKKKGVMLFFETINITVGDMIESHCRELWLLDDMRFVIISKKRKTFYANSKKYSVYFNEVEGILSEEHGFTLSPIDFGMLLVAICFEQEHNEPIGALLHLEGKISLEKLMNED